MNMSKLLAMTVLGVAFASVAGAGVLTDTAVRQAKNKAVSVEKVAVAVATAVQGDSVAPSQIFSQVLEARASWTAAQVAFLYKSILLASPELSSSLGDDIKTFEAAGKPTTVSPDAPEGVRLLAILYGTELNGVNPDVVLASIAADSTGEISPSVAALRDVPVRRPAAVIPTPPATSSDN